MGQYWHAVLKCRSGKIMAYNQQLKGSQDYNGLKLMEHSWWYNDFCRAVAYKLTKEPAKVAWVGDYAEPDELKRIHFPVKSYDMGSNNEIEPAPENFQLDDMKYLVNRTKRLFIDLQKYKHSADVDGWIIFPLSILTALSNGRGGGDYHENGDEPVGEWTGNLIEFTNTVPKGYHEFEVVFKEY